MNRVLGFEEGFALVNVGTREAPKLERWALFFDETNTLRGRPEPVKTTPIDQIKEATGGAAERRALAMRSIDQLRTPGS